MDLKNSEGILNKVEILAKIWWQYFRKGKLIIIDYRLHCRLEISIEMSGIEELTWLLVEK